MSEIHEVPIVEVHTGNFNEIWPGLVLAIRAATFVAIDTVSKTSLNVTVEWG